MPISDGHLGRYLWKYPDVNATKHGWWLLNIFHVLSWYRQALTICWANIDQCVQYVSDIIVELQSVRNKKRNKALTYIQKSFSYVHHLATHFVM